MKKGIMQNKLFFCDHLGNSEDDERDIMNFTVKRQSGMGLVNYLKYRAFPDELMGNMRTYIVRDSRTMELAGYFSLKSGLISLNEVLTDEGTDFDTLPGIELANFAINDGYIQKHKNQKGVGLVLFTDFIVPIIERCAEDVGIRLIYIFALPEDDLIERYEKDYGFARLDKKSEDELHRRLKPGCDKSCIFMYQTLK